MGNNPQQTTRTRSDPQRAKTTHNDLTRWKKSTMSQSNAKQSTKIQQWLKGKLPYVVFPALSIVTERIQGLFPTFLVSIKPL